MKGKKDKNKLVPVKKIITRGGKTFETTVYVRQGQINEHTKHKEQINVDEYAKGNWSNINTVEDFMAARNKIFSEKDTSKREALRDEFIRHFESMGVTYNHCDTNSGVDWMRFMMRTKKMLANGDLSQEGVKEQKYMRLDAKKSKELVQACSKQVGNDELMKAIEEAGIDYKKSNNKGINRMRALMALREHIQDGKAFDLITDREINPNYREESGFLLTKEEESILKELAIEADEPIELMVLVTSKKQADVVKKALEGAEGNSRAEKLQYLFDKYHEDKPKEKVDILDYELGEDQLKDLDFEVRTYKGGSGYNGEEVRDTEEVRNKTILINPNILDAYKSHTKKETKKHLDEIIYHEMGHVFMEMYQGLSSHVLGNPNDIFGVSDRKQGKFISSLKKEDLGGCGWHPNGEESYCDYHSLFCREPERMKKEYPEVYRFFDDLSKKIPNYDEKVKDMYNKHVEAITNLAKEMGVKNPYTPTTKEDVQREVDKCKHIKLKKIVRICAECGMSVEVDKVDKAHMYIHGDGKFYLDIMGVNNDDGTHGYTIRVRGTDDNKEFTSSSRAKLVEFVQGVLDDRGLKNIVQDENKDEGLTDEKWTTANYKEPQVENAFKLGEKYGFTVTKKGNTYTMSNGDVTIKIEKTTGSSGNAKFTFAASGNAVKDKFGKKELVRDGVFTEKEATWWTQKLFDKLGLEQKEGAKEEKPKEIPNVKYFDLDLKTAKLAHEMNSFRDFKDPTPDYKARVDALYEVVNNFPDEYKEEGLRRAEAFSKKLADWYNQYFSIEARMPSMMISGGGNFNCRKKEKQNQARDKHWERYNDIKAMAEKIKDIPNRKKQQKPKDVREELKQLEESQQRMKDANAYYRKNKTMVGFSGFSDFVNKNIDKAIKDGRLYKPFESFELTNNNAKIKRLRAKVKLLDQLDGKTEEQTKAEYDTDEFEVIENTDKMRIQLKFPAKPDKEINALLHKHSFKWNWREKVWQRQLTNNGKYATKRLIEDIKELRAKQK